VADEILPLLQPVAERLVTWVPGLPTAGTVLDVACGTGEPGLTLARHYPQARILGIDASEMMIAVARSKTARQQVPGLSRLSGPAVGAAQRRGDVTARGRAEGEVCHQRRAARAAKAAPVALMRTSSTEDTRLR
jgi:SAM-dependent methyltransferase